MAEGARLESVYTFIAYRGFESHRHRHSIFYGHSMSNAQSKITPVVLSGGQGTRLRPLSRSNEPKQFIPLINDATLFEDTISRVQDHTLFASPLIICAQKHRFLVKKLLPSSLSDDAQVIMEPCGRNTAAAICAAALAAPGADDILLILPSDHYIPDAKAFGDAVRAASDLARDGQIITFGIRPTGPHTGFGYIKRGDELAPGYKVASFHEKPDQETAQAYLKEGGYDWNAGIFMMRADIILQELERHAPDILSAVRAAWEARNDDLGDILLDPEAFAEVRAQSIDYAVLEHTDRAVVMPADFSWDDLGSWDALWRIAGQDKTGNYKKGAVYTHDVSGSYLRSEGPVLTVLGMEDVVAVAMPDAVFVAPKARSEEVKNLVGEMKKAGQVQVTENPKTLRPWGSYEVMEEKEGFKVKKLSVHPGCRLSLQKHKYRSEHWVVVKGIATVTRDEDVFDVPVNESVYVPCGTVHRLENKQEDVLEIIEVQTGSYLGEDDIIRLEDDYNREKLHEQKVANI